MKVCITTKGEGLESELDPRFGRAANILLVDTNTNDVRPLGNAADASHGAGVQAAQTVLDAGIEVLVTGRIGPRAYEVLAAASIPIYVSTAETAADALRHFMDGRLVRLSAASSPLHGGMRT
jgi:predicted Fe-Mo cluster-binding NifX family protein